MTNKFNLLSSLFIATMLMMLPMAVSAETVEIDGIWYNIVTKANIAEVTKNPSVYSYYSGDVIIPEKVSYNGVDIPVTRIGDSAFQECSNLTSVTLPNSVSSIGTCAFQDCSELTTITIPSSMRSIEYSAFSRTGLTSVHISDLLDWFKIDFRTSGANPLSWAEHLYIGGQEVKDLTIPDGVTSIQKYAFEGCRGLTSVTFSNSVKSIGESAFAHCGITSLTIPNSVTSIGAYAFVACHELTSVNLPNSLTSIADHAFEECRSLSSITIPSSITTIEDGTFACCSSLISVDIPDNVTSIGYSAFQQCSSLISVTIPQNMINIKSGAFGYCEKLADVYSKAVQVGSAGLTTDPNAFINSYQEYITLHVPAASIEAYRAVEPWKYFKGIVSLESTKYKLIYMVDGVAYKTYELYSGTAITPEAAPEKEGYTFSGWSDIPTTMPAKDVTVTGTFTVNKYKLVYQVDGAEYKSYEVEYGSTITPEAAPTKEGYTFSGWDNLPATMPAKDVTVSGTFTINKYKLVYMVDGEEYKSYDVEYKSKVTPEEAPAKEGYTFSGWSEIPDSMPAKDVTVSGTFTVNKYKLVYIVDGEEYKTIEVEYGSTITPEENPTKEGYMFSGWSEIPETMPAHDVTVTGSFSKGAYTLTYIVDGETYKTYSYDYGDAVTPEAYPEKEGYTFSGWDNVPETMPAGNVTVTGYFTVNKYTITYYVDGEVYKTVEVEYGSEITAEEEPTKEGYDFSGWSWIPSKMPAEDVTVTGSFTKASYEVDGATYQIDENGATLTSADNAAGDEVLDATVTINGKTYRITVIGEGAFQGNDRITSLTVPDGIEVIMQNAFDGCSKLMKLMLGKNVRYIGSKAFAGIGKAAARTRADAEPLTIECYAESVPQADSDCFEGVDVASAVLRVNDELTGVYKTTSPWNQFGSILGFNEAASVGSIFADEEGAEIYSIDGKRIDKVKKGMNIIRTREGVRKVVVK